MPHEPKKKHSKAAKRVRRASITLNKVALVSCKNCQQLTPTHSVCKSCGFYAGKELKGSKIKATVTKA